MVPHQAAESLTALKFTVTAANFLTGINQAVAQALMVSLGMKVQKKLGDRSP
jgi:hypothetical protein